MAGHREWSTVRRLPDALATGAKDLKVAKHGFEILTEPASFEPVDKTFADANAIAAVNRLVDALKEHDDVKEVFSTAESSGETASA